MRDRIIIADVWMESLLGIGRLSLLFERQLKNKCWTGPAGDVWSIKGV